MDNVRHDFAVCQRRIMSPKHNIKSDSSALFITARDLQLRENAELPISLPSRILGVLNLHME